MFVNLTPHAIVIATKGEGYGILDECKWLTIQPSGMVARVYQASEDIDSIHCGRTKVYTENSLYMNGHEFDEWETDEVIPVRRATYGNIEGLPDPEPGTRYIVSGMVRTALGDTRPDVFAPDTGPSAIRYAGNYAKNGQIKAVTGLIGVKPASHKEPNQGPERFPCGGCGKCEGCCYGQA